MKNYEEFMYKAYAMYWHASYNNLRSKLKRLDQTSKYPDDVYEGFLDIMEELEKFDKLDGLHSFDVEDFDKYIQENVIKSEYVEAIIEKKAEDRVIYRVLPTSKEENYLADIEMLEKYSRDLEERLEKKYGEKVEKDNQEE